MQLLSLKIFLSRCYKGNATYGNTTICFSYFASAKAYEVGTKITPSYSAKLNAGSYSYGPATGITATSWSVSATGVETLLPQQLVRSQKLL